MQKSTWLSAAIVGTAKGSGARIAVCAIAQLADEVGAVHAHAGALDGARMDTGAPDMEMLAAQLRALVGLGWLAPLEWGPSGDLRTALTVPEGVGL